MSAQLPSDAAERKRIPIVTGCLDYFPDAVAEVARLSKVANEQHNPGQPMHWDRSKSTDHADCIGRHLVQRGTLDDDGMRHSAKVAWRALALLQTEIEVERESVCQPLTLGDVIASQNGRGRCSCGEDRDTCGLSLRNCGDPSITNEERRR